MVPSGRLMPCLLADRNSSSCCYSWNAMYSVNYWLYQKCLELSSPLWQNHRVSKDTIKRQLLHPCPFVLCFLSFLLVLSVVSYRKRGNDVNVAFHKWFKCKKQNKTKKTALFSGLMMQRLVLCKRILFSNPVKALGSVTLVHEYGCSE